MIKLRKYLVVLGLAALGPAGCAGVEPPATRLVGQVVRGPIQPVCQVDLPCDAPFSADFTVRQGGQFVTTFRSDPQGRFAVSLAPGVYTIVPGPDAPLLSPGEQVKVVTVDPDGTTVVRLDFDTGLR